MIIVAGSIATVPGRRDEFVRRSLEAVAAARATTGCLDFVVAADPLDPDRVNVYERWDSDATLEDFRGSGPGADLSPLIANLAVRRYRIAE